MIIKKHIKQAYFPKGTIHAIKELTEEILKFTVGTGAQGGIIGLSGGIDSTTVAYLTKKAFDQYNQNETKEKQLKILGLILPSDANNPKDTNNGIKIAKELGIKTKIIPIEPIAQSYKKVIPEALKEKFDMGNLYSEIRATIISREGAARNYRIIGTGNRDEDYVLGYFTKRGDGAVDNNILGKLPKRLVRELAKELGVPKNLVHKTPSAGLWKGQTDEKELGYTYEQAEIIQNGFDEGKNVEEIAKITGYNQKIIHDVNWRHHNTEHKRQIPPTGKVTLAHR